MGDECRSPDGHRGDEVEHQEDDGEHRVPMPPERCPRRKSPRAPSRNRTSRDRRDPDAAEERGGVQRRRPPKIAPGKIARRSAGSAPNSVPIDRMFALKSPSLCRQPRSARTPTTITGVIRIAAPLASRANEGEQGGNDGEEERRRLVREEEEARAPRRRRRGARRRAPREPLDGRHREDEHGEPHHVRDEPPPHHPPAHDRPEQEREPPRPAEPREEASSQGRSDRDREPDDQLAREVRGNRRAQAQRGEVKQLVRLRRDHRVEPVGGPARVVQVAHDRDERLVHRQIRHRRVPHEDDRRGEEQPRDPGGGALARRNPCAGHRSARSVALAPPPIDSVSKRVCPTLRRASPCPHARRAAPGAYRSRPPGDPAQREVHPLDAGLELADATSCRRSSRSPPRHAMAQALHGVRARASPRQAYTRSSTRGGSTSRRKNGGRSARARRCARRGSLATDLWPA